MIELVIVTTLIAAMIVVALASHWEYPHMDDVLSELDREDAARD